MDLTLFGWAQMDSPNSLLVALTRKSGILLFADGYTMGRPALPLMRPAQDKWWLLPHPLQVIDAKCALTWNLRGASDFFEAAAGHPAGSYLARTHHVPVLLRNGVLSPAAPDHEGRYDEPRIAFECFWACLSSDRDERWQKWPYDGLDKLPP